MCLKQIVWVKRHENMINLLFSLLICLSRFLKDMSNSTASFVDLHTSKYLNDQGSVNNTKGLHLRRLPETPLLIGCQKHSRSN